MLKTVHSEYPVAMTWVPSRELQRHQDTVTDHTTFSAALSLELSELLFGTGKPLLGKTIVCTDTEVYLASPSPRLEEKILRVIQKYKEGLDRVNNLVRTISEGGTWGVRWLIHIICPHFSKILTLVVLSRGIIDFCLFHFIFFTF